jgi:Uma2 family endonuclease
VVPLIIEVVSTNWRDDYLLKLGDYKRLGIQEYWIIDYLGLGGRLYIGHPKRPTLSIYRLVDGEYDVERFSADEFILSPAFPELALTAAQVFGASRLS